MFAEVESVELPVYVAVPFSTDSFHDAVDRMNLLARDGYRVVEKVDKQRTKANQRGPASEVVEGYFLLELAPVQEITIEAIPSLFEESTDSDRESLAAHAFVGDEGQRESAAAALLRKEEEPSKG